MRRRAPRRLGDVIGEVAGASRPETLLARVQASWNGVVGAAIANEAQPVSESGGTLVVACSSSLWAQELELSSRDLLDRLNEALGGGGGEPLKTLRTKLAPTT